MHQVSILIGKFVWNSIFETGGENEAKMIDITAKKTAEKTYFLEIAKVAGILIWYLLTSVSWIASPKTSDPVSDILVTRLLEAIAGYIVISVYFIIFNNLDKKVILSKRYFIFLLFPICCLVSMSWNFFGIILQWLFKSDCFACLCSYFLIKSLFYLIPTLAFTGLYYTINHWIKYQQQREKALIATNLANEAQLQMLRYQINPHFLFNTLNTIRQMVEEDQGVARKMITELSGFFRYSLSQKENIDTFENEIIAIKNYFEIQKIRFEEKLVIVYDIDERCLPVKLPFVIVLPLIENAVKYGLQTSTMPLTIKISAIMNSHLEIKVQNTGRIITGTPVEEGTNTGIENIRKRLDLCYPGKYSFSLYEKDSWVTAQIIIMDFKCQMQG